MDRMPIPRERSNSLSEQLSRRQRITDMEEGDTITPLMQVFNPRLEFEDIPIADLIKYEETFEEFDKDGTGFLTLEGIKCAMRKLGTVMTHMELVHIIRDLHSDREKTIDLREFITIYKKLGTVTAARVSKNLKEEVEVGKVGVGGAKHFFEDRAARTVESPYETKLRLEKEKAERKREKEEQSKRNLSAKASAFGQVKRTKTPAFEAEKPMSTLKIRKIKSRKSLDNVTGVDLRRQGSLGSYSSEYNSETFYSSRSASIGSFTTYSNSSAP